MGSGGERLPCESLNCGGYTLEAELCIRPNSTAGPDFDGWEIKQLSQPDKSQFGRKALTLMTPEPDGGLYCKKGVEAFVRQFGYPDRMGRKDRINFGGIHRAFNRHERTGLLMRIE